MAANRSIVVYGAGAVGCYLGARLAAGGTHRVTLVGRQRLVEAVELRGLILRERGAETVTHPAAVTSSAGLPPCDLIILAVRAYDVEAAISDVRALIPSPPAPRAPTRGVPTGERGDSDQHASLEAPLSPKGRGAGGEGIGGERMILAMQNGVGSEEALAEALGRERVLAGTITFSVGMDEPGIVTRFGPRGGLGLATMDGSSVPEWIVQAFGETGLPTAVVDDYRSLRWSKLTLNMLGAAASAILDIDLPQLVTDPALFRLEQLAVREAGRVMDAQQIRTVRLPGYPVPLLRLAMRFPRPLAQRLIAPRLTQSRRGRSPGARADMARGKSEIPILNGAVAEAAARLGLPAPVNAAFSDLTQELLVDPERREWFRGHPERLIASMRERGVRRM